MANPSRTSPSLDAATSPALAGILAAEVADHADAVEHRAAEEGQSRVSAARVRNLRRHAAQLEAISQDGAE